MNPTEPALADYKINVKIKLAALWTAVMFCYIYGDYFNLYPPGQVEDLLKGKTMLDNPIKLFGASIMMTIPSVMIFLSVVLKPALNKWLNIIFGVIFTAIMALIAITSHGEWMLFYVYLAIVEIIITSLVVWHAWSWPTSNQTTSVD